MKAVDYVIALSCGLIGLGAALAVMAAAALAGCAHGAGACLPDVLHSSDGFVAVGIPVDPNHPELHCVLYERTANGQRCGYYVCSEDCRSWQTAGGGCDAANAGEAM